MGQSVPKRELLTMITISANKLTSFAGSLTLAGLLFASPISAAPVTYTFDFASGGTENNSSAGNTWTYLDNGGTQQVTITSWSDTGTGDTLEAATGHLMTNGLGVCNPDESSLDDCITNENTAGMDNKDGEDWVLLVFAETMDLSEFSVFPEIETGSKKSGRNVTYFTGWIDSATDIAGANYTDLTDPMTSGGFGLKQFDVKNKAGTTAATVTLADETAGASVWGNAILIGASQLNGGSGNSTNVSDTILMSSMTTVVPIPAAVWLFASGLVTLLTRRKIKAN
jgi:hypothetical protein